MEADITIKPEVHFVCIGGCGLTATQQQKCLTPGCWRARNPLGECDCTDGLHTAFNENYHISPKDAEKLVE